jgi:hypothetical protein
MSDQPNPPSTPECPAVTVSRRISARPGVIFAILADPHRHTEIDGSGMLRGAVTGSVITGTGDEFMLNMFFERHGDYQMINRVVEFEPGRRIAWEPRNVVDEDAMGHRWGYELEADGPDATVVTEIFECARWPEAERAEMEGGRIWISAMEETLERLDKMVLGL